jgi:NADH-quinone oxidoreductase subunit H
VATILFLGGWTMPDLYFFVKFFNIELYIHIDEFFYNLRLEHYYITWLYHSLVYILKVYAYLFAFIWVRATLPRYRYDQLMRLGWKVFVPITLGLVFISISLTLLFDGFMTPGGYVNHFFSPDIFI